MEKTSKKSSDFVAGNEQTALHTGYQMTDKKGI